MTDREIRTYHKLHRVEQRLAPALTSTLTEGMCGSASRHFGCGCRELGDPPPCRYRRHFVAILSRGGYHEWLRITGRAPAFAQAI